MPSEIDINVNIKKGQDDSKQVKKSLDNISNSTKKANKETDSLDKTKKRSLNGTKLANQASQKSAQTTNKVSEVNSKAAKSIEKTRKLTEVGTKATAKVDAIANKVASKSTKAISKVEKETKVSKPKPIIENVIRKVNVKENLAKRIAPATQKIIQKVVPPKKVKTPALEAITKKVVKKATPTELEEQKAVKSMMAKPRDVYTKKAAKVFKEVTTPEIKKTKGISNLGELSDKMKKLGTMAQGYNQTLMQTKKLSAMGWSSEQIDSMQEMGIGAKDVQKSIASLGWTMTKSGKIYDEHAKIVKDVTKDQRLNQAIQDQMIMKSTKSLGAQAQLITMANKMGVSSQNLSKTMTSQNIAMDKNGNFYDTVSKKGIDYNAMQNQVVMSSKRFRMELLSVMFFGMAVARMFGSLTKGAAEAAGFLAVWSNFTTMLGLPAYLELTDALLKLYDIYDGLPDGMKKVIAWTLVGGQAAGWAMQQFGMFGLGIMGLTKLFPAWGAAVAKAGGLFKWLGTTIGGGGWLAGIGKVAGVFGAIAASAVGLYNVISGIFEGNMWKIAIGTLLVLAGVLGFVFGGWVAALIAGIGFGLMWLGNKSEKAAAIIMTSMAPVILQFTLLYDLIKGVIALFSGGSFKERISGFLGAFKSGASTGYIDAIKNKWSGSWWGSSTSSTPKMASGGIVTRPTKLIAGEAGPEAIIPLHKYINSGTSMNIDYKPNITINANMDNSADISYITKRVNESLYRDLRRAAAR